MSQNIFIKRSPGATAPFNAFNPDNIVQPRDPQLYDIALSGTQWTNPANNKVFVATSTNALGTTWVGAAANGAQIVPSLEVTGGAGTVFQVDAGNSVLSSGDLTLSSGNLSVTGNSVFNGDVSITGDFDLVDTGSITLTSTDNAPNAIELHTNGGTAETMNLLVSQGTGVASLAVTSTAGGVTVTGGRANVNAINLTTSDAAGGMTFSAGTSGIVEAITNGVFTVTTGTGTVSVSADATANTVNIGTGAGAKTVSVGSTNSTSALTLSSGSGAMNIGTVGAKTITVGNVTGASAVVVNSGTGGIAMNTTGAGDFVVASADTVLIDSAGVLELNSSAGVIGIGNDAVAQNINIGTGAAARVVTIGNVSGASQVVLNSGTAGVAINTTGAGDVVVTSADTVLIDAAGVLELNSSAGVISIGNDAVAQNINIGTGAAARVITIGNVSGASEVALNAGSAGVVITPTNSVFTVNSGTGTVAISGDAAATTVGLGTGAGAKTVTIGSSNTTSTTTVQAGSGGIALNASGSVKMAPGTVSAAAYAATLSKQVGAVTLTGQVLASAATQVLTITNTLCTTSTPMFVTVANLGTNDAQLTITRVQPKAGSFEVTVKNNGAAALNGDIQVNFWMLS